MNKPKQAIVCFLEHSGMIALAAKKTKIGKGYLNGYGGMVEIGESLVDAVVREVYEETDRGVIIDPEGLAKIAEGHMTNLDSCNKEIELLVHFYLARVWHGQIRESSEMGLPEWHSISEIPLERLMPADRHWLKITLAGRKSIIKAKYGPFQKNLVGEVKIIEVDNFS